MPILNSPVSLGHVYIEHSYMPQYTRLVLRVCLHYIYIQDRDWRTILAAKLTLEYIYTVKSHVHLAVSTRIACSRVVLSLLDKQYAVITRELSAGCVYSNRLVIVV